MVYRGSKLNVRHTVKEDILVKAAVNRKYMIIVQKTDRIINQPKSLTDGIIETTGKMLKKNGMINVKQMQPPTI